MTLENTTTAGIDWSANLATRLLGLCTDAVAVVHLAADETLNDSTDPPSQTKESLAWHNRAFGNLAEQQSLSPESLMQRVLSTISPTAELVASTQTTLDLANETKLLAKVEELTSDSVRLIVLSPIAPNLAEATPRSSDVVTGLADRRQLLQELKQRLATQPVAPFSLLFIDLDGFKQVNDTLGHQAGDAALVEVADRLKQTLRDGDTISRYGGDEFICLLSGVTTPEEVEPILARLEAAISQPLACLEGQTSVSASIGVGYLEVDENGTSRMGPEALIHAADCAMYASKKQLS